MSGTTKLVLATVSGVLLTYALYMDAFLSTASFAPPPLFLSLVALSLSHFFSFSLSLSLSLSFLVHFSGTTLTTISGRAEWQCSNLGFSSWKFAKAQQPYARNRGGCVLLRRLQTAFSES